MGSSGRLSNELRIITDLARVVAAGPYEVGDILERICSEIRAAFGFERALIARYDANERTIFAVVQQGFEWPGTQWLMLDRFSFLREALEAGRAVFVRDARAEQAVPSKIIERFGVRSIVAAPLLVEGECLGFIVGDRRGGGGEFDLDPHELEFLTTLGSVAAVFVAKADQYEALQQALDELRGLDRAKDEFVSIASHELRTPISVVHGIAMTLQTRGDELDPEQREALRSALGDQTSRLRELAEQLLDLSQLDAGAVSLEPRRFKALLQIEGLLDRVAPDRSAQVELEIDPELEVTCDPYAFERILSNLILNALRYGEPPVTVRGGDGGNAVRITVEDRGKGVDPDFAPYLFARFTRSRQSQVDHPGGAGLGLSIAHSFARSVGGDLSYVPAAPSGACFRLELPR
jgi:signal transduction histidine kinase